MSTKADRKMAEILAFLRTEIEEKGYPPSVREICTAVKLKSPSTVHGYLVRLEEQGHIKKDPSKSRTIMLLEDENTLQSSLRAKPLPVLGTVAAGQPILAIENIEGYFPLPDGFITKDASFLLHVKGDSMINAGILNGDMVIIKEQNYADNGEIVLALVDDSATIKTLYKEKNHVRLQPQNDFMEPIIVKDVQILGKVVGLFRSF